MGCIITCFGKLCCASCRLCGSGCSKVSPTAGYTTRLPYLMFIFVGIIIAMIFREWGGEVLLDLYFWDLQACTTEACAGNQAILRMSFAMTLFFFTFYLFMCSASTAAIHHKGWGIKIVYFILLIIVAYIMPDNFFTGYARLAMVGGGVFLLLQVVLLIDIGYRWNSSWLEKERNIWRVLILVFTAILLIVSIVFWILMFGYFTSEDGCTLQEFVLVMLILCSVGVILLSATAYIEHGAILTSAVVVAYCTYLVNNGLKSDPSSCNSFSEYAAGSNATESFIGIVIASISVTYSSWSLTNKQHNLFGTNDEDEEQVNYYEEAPANGDDDNLPPEEEDEQLLLTEDVVKTNRLFHLIMVTASMYMGMLLTGWSSDITDSSESVFALSTQAMWVNLSANWIAFALYIWTLIAPQVCTSREF